MQLLSNLHGEYVVCLRQKSRDTLTPAHAKIDLVANAFFSLCIFTAGQILQNRTTAQFQGHPLLQAHLSNRPVPSLSSQGPFALDLLSTQ